MKIRVICIFILLAIVLSKKSVSKKKKASIKKSKADSKDSKAKDSKKASKVQKNEELQKSKKTAVSAKVNVKSELEKILKKKDDGEQQTTSTTHVENKEKEQEHHVENKEESTTHDHQEQEHHVESNTPENKEEHHENSTTEQQHTSTEVNQEHHVENKEQNHTEQEQNHDHVESTVQEHHESNNAVEQHQSETTANPVEEHKEENHQQGQNEEKKISFSIENKDQIQTKIKQTEEKILSKLEDPKRLQSQKQTDDKNKDNTNKLKNFMDKGNTKSNKPEKVYVMNPKPYESKFVNGSRPLPPNNSPIPKDWEDASYVKQISTYSKKFLRDINDPKKKSKAMLVGKPLYIEGGYTFDDQPVLLQESAPHMTGVNVVQRQYATQEKSDLWSKWLNGEFRQNFKDVAFNSNDTNSYYYNSGIEDVINGKSVKISLTNKNKAFLGKPANDTILGGLTNPIKRVIYTKERQNELIVDKVNLNENNKMQDIKRMKQNKVKITNSKQDDKTQLIRKWVDPTMRK